MDIHTVLSCITTLSPEKKAHLTQRFTAGTLSPEEKAELEAHVLQSMATLGAETEVAEKLLHNAP